MKKLFLNVVLVSVLFLSAAVKAETQEEDLIAAKAIVLGSAATGGVVGGLSGIAVANTVAPAIASGGTTFAAGYAIVFGSSIGIALGTAVAVGAAGLMIYDEEFRGEVIDLATHEDWAKALEEEKDWTVLNP